MGILNKKKKKYDIDKDRLMIIFNHIEKKYECYFGYYPISLDELTRKSKKIINNKNKQLLTEPQLLEKELEAAKIKQRFKKLQSLGYTCGSFEYLGEVKGTMSSQLEEFLNKLTTENDILLGIHRIKESTPQHAIEDILKNGLKMTGHQDGAIPNTNQLQNNISYYPDNKTIIKELMYADLFKNAKGSILIRIPDEELSKNIYVRDNEGIIRLNPKYIVGYVPLCENHHIEQIIQVKPTINATYNFHNNQHNLQTFDYTNCEPSKSRR